MTASTMSCPRKVSSNRAAGVDRHADLGGRSTRDDAFDAVILVERRDEGVSPTHVAVVAALVDEDHVEAPERVQQPARIEDAARADRGRGPPARHLAVGGVSVLAEVGRDRLVGTLDRAAARHEEDPVVLVGRPDRRGLHVEDRIRSVEAGTAGDLGRQRHLPHVIALGHRQRVGIGAAVLGEPRGHERQVGERAEEPEQRGALGVGQVGGSGIDIAAGGGDDNRGKGGHRCAHR